MTPLYRTDDMEQVGGSLQTAGQWSGGGGGGAPGSDRSCY
jgi:hypothetical protein